jgi:hypothetical protein
MVYLKLFRNDIGGRGKLPDPVYVITDLPKGWTIETIPEMGEELNLELLPFDKKVFRILKAKVMHEYQKGVKRENKRGNIQPCGVPWNNHPIIVETGRGLVSPSLESQVDDCSVYRSQGRAPGIVRNHRDRSIHQIKGWSHRISYPRIRSGYDKSSNLAETTGG